MGGRHGLDVFVCGRCNAWHAVGGVPWTVDGQAGKDRQTSAPSERYLTDLEIKI